MKIMISVFGISFLVAFSTFAWGNDFDPKSCETVHYDDGNLFEFSEEYKQYTDLKTIRVAALKKPFLNRGCIPSTEKILLGYIWPYAPKVLTSIEGHTFDVEVTLLLNKPLLVVTYNAGGNAFTMRVFEILKESIKPIEKAIFTSNMRSISFLNGKVRVKNSKWSGEDRVVEESSYEYKNGSFDEVN